jgi:hypothetical protein
MHRRLVLSAIAGVISAATPVSADECFGEACTADSVEAALPAFRSWRLEATPFGGAMVGDPDEVTVLSGLTTRVYLHNRLAFGLEGALHHRRPLSKEAEAAEVRARRLALGIHLAWIAMSGRLGADSDSAIADLYLLGGGGIISTQHHAADPRKPRLDFTEMATIGLGSRVMFSSWLGVVAEARGSAIFDGGFDAPTPAFEGRLGLTTMWPPRALERVAL